VQQAAAEKLYNRVGISFILKQNIMNAVNSTNKKIPPLQKRTVAVLTENEMVNIDGGSTLPCAGIFSIYSSEVCAGVLISAVVVLTDAISR
jgi:hypothetical protein